MRVEYLNLHSIIYLFMLLNMIIFLLKNKNKILKRLNI